MTRYVLATMSAGLVLASLAVPVAWSAQPGPMERFVEEQTLAVIRLDIHRLNTEAMWTWLDDRLKPLESMGRAAAVKPSAPLRKWIDDFTKAGARQIHAFVNGIDLPTSPFLVVTLADGADANAVRETLKQIGDNQTQIVTIDGCLVFGREHQIARLQKAALVTRPAFVQAATAVGDAPMAAMLSLSEDARKALNELMPTLPESVGGGPVSTVTQGLQWAALAIDAPPKVAARLKIQSDSPADAQALNDLLRRSLKLLADNAHVRKDVPAIDTVTAMVQPRVANDSLELTMDSQAVTKVMDELFKGLAHGKAGRVSATTQSSQAPFTLEVAHLFAQQP